jgi:3-keto-5-aminohexanoate cleavage enzyme
MEKDLYVWDYRDPYEWMRRVGQAAFPPLIITCAITGGLHGKESNEYLPESAEEQADQVYECYKAGAVSVHVHVRDPGNLAMTTNKPEYYSQVNKLIRERCPDIIINNTTGGSPGMSLQERLACLYADPAPDMASLNLGPFMVKMVLGARKPPLTHQRDKMLFDACVPASYGDVNAFAKTMKERGIKPEIELYHPGQYWVMRDLIREKNIDPPYMVQFVLGFQTASYPTPANVLSIINELPPQSIFAIIGVGPFQIPMNVMSIIVGGHVRVGMEDNLYFRKGEKVRSNAQLVSRIKRIAQEMNREIATIAQAREMLGLRQV